MADPKKDLEEEDLDYVPASPTMRTFAWIGLAYALLFLCLTTYYFYTGTMLANLGPLLVLPGLIGMGILALVSWRTTGRPGKWSAIGLAVVCWLLALLSIPMAVVGFLSNFGG